MLLGAQNQPESYPLTHRCWLVVYSHWKQITAGLFLLLSDTSSCLEFLFLYFLHLNLMKLTSLLCCVPTTLDALDSDTATSKSTKSATKAKTDPSKLEPYTPARVSALFAEYADEDDEDVIGPEGFEKLCSDAGISLEGALPLILAWQLSASEMAKVKKAEWEKAMTELRCASWPLSCDTHSTLIHPTGYPAYLRCQLHYMIWRIS